MTTSQSDLSTLRAAAPGGSVAGRASIRSFRGVAPRIHPSAWVAPGAVIVGDVELAEDASVWYGCVLRGDVHSIRVGARSNIQDGSVLHVTQDRFACEVGREVTVGHRAVVHGCTIGDGALIGIGAIVLDGARVGAGALVGAGAVVTPGTAIGEGMVAIGAPAREIRALTEGERRDQLARTLAYVDHARGHAASEQL